MIIDVEKLSYEYSPNSVFAYHALKEVTTSIKEGSLNYPMNIHLTRCLPIML